MTKAYVATVQLLIVAESDAHAMDAISNILSEYDMWDGVLKDWAYLRVGGQILSPTETYIDEENYEEGDFLA